MAKILYGVCGEGFGHSSRSETVASLLDRHEIVFAASQNAYKHLASIGKRVIKVQGLGFALKDNRIDVLQTLGKNLKGLEALSSVGNLLDFCKTFKPDLVITDFEPFTSVAAKLIGKPLVSIDHEKIIDRTRIEYPQRFATDCMAASIITANMVPFADRYIISSFFYPPVKDKSTIVLPPLIRNGLIGMRPKAGEHVVVYQSYEANEQLDAILEGIQGERFIIYGGQRGKRGNLIFKPHSNREFVKDLASSKAVITNGGYTLISEALYLGKPILSMPVAGQFEQVLNAYYLDKLGYGKYYDELDEVKVIGFLHNLDRYRKNVKRMRKCGSRQLMAELKPYLD